MNKIDMSDFLREITECCSTSKITTEHGDCCFDPEKLSCIQNKLKDFALKYKKEIMQLYSYLEGEGKYKLVYSNHLIEWMDKYEEYHNDMVSFIDSLTRIDNERIDNLETFQELLKQAYEADKKFLTKFTSQDEEEMLFADALENTEVMIRLIVLIDEMNDNYIKLFQVSEMKDSERITGCTKFYIDSTIGFMEFMATKFFECIEMLINVMTGNHEFKEKIVGEFKLI